MSQTLHIRIIKDYAVNIISDLKTLGAVELINEEAPDEVAKWQKDEVLRLKEYYERNPNELLSWEDVRRQLRYK